MKIEVFYRASVEVEADTIEEAARKYEGLDLGNVIETTGAHNEETGEDVSDEFDDAL